MREVEVSDPDGHRICLAEDVSGASLSGHQVWDGVLDLGATKPWLSLKLAPSSGGLVGRLDSPDQGARDLPIDSVEREGSTLRFAMAAIGASFEGELRESDGSIAGTWTQRGRSWPLTFARARGARTTGRR
jgi:hypothetical protein